MKQVVQSYKTGEVTLREMPVPQCGSKRILVKNRHSLVSIGTERMTIELGRKSLLGKAKARPDLVRRVWEKAKQEGLLKTYQEAMGRLDAPTPLGYSCSGVVVESGVAASAFTPGDRVACIGQGFASHADFVSVPPNLACRIPEKVSDEAATFGMLGIIALHGIRRADLSFGSHVTVLGLGLLGLLSVQILQAYGCQVTAMDLDARKVNLAQQLGVSFATIDGDGLQQQVHAVTHGHGADAVLITAASKSREPVDLAIRLSRSRAKIVVVGTADIHPDRNELWQKEVELLVSRAAGPGSLDPLYELEGVDLPIAEVRWTQNRNLQEFLRLVSEERVQLDPLITHRISFSKAEQTYRRLMDGEMQDAVGVVLNYPEQTPIERHLRFPQQKTGPSGKNEVGVGVLGAGLFGKALLLPALAKTAHAKLHTLVTTSGVNAEHSAKRFGFQSCATDETSLWNEEEINAVVALTPHHTHARLVKEAIAHQRPLFLEKPLCVTPEELDELIQLIEKQKRLPIVQVGHNRRFSPHVQQMQKWLQHRVDPLVLQMRVNAGYVPPDHWVHSESEGRSRIVGEMSHFIDLMQAMIGSLPVQIHAERVDGNNRSVVNNDNIVALLKFADGSVGSLTYSASGDKGYSREAIEIFFDRKTIRSQDFRKSELYASGKQAFKTMSQEMGYREELQHFIDCVRGKEQPAVSMEETLWSMRTVFGIERALATRETVRLENA